MTKIYHHIYNDDRKINKIHQSKEAIYFMDKKEIENYLDQVKALIKRNKYIISLNDNRCANQNLFLDYIVTEAMAKDILLSLTVTDFSCIKQNHHQGYEHERLYVFGKNVTLVSRYDHSVENVGLYIKMNKIGNDLVIVISMHKQRFPLTYVFKDGR